MTAYPFTLKWQNSFVGHMVFILIVFFLLCICLFILAFQCQ